MKYNSLVILLLPILFQGCLLAPRVDQASVLTPKELRIVTYMQKGKDYTLSGRLEAAELVLRKARRLAPENAVILNDLGFVLHSQLRYSEALNYYMQAIAKDKNLLEAKQNLARLFFDIGQNEQALIRYQELLSYFLTLERKTNVSQNASITQINRSLSQIYYKIGKLDESLCYSSKTFLYGPASNPEQFTQHIRLLMSLNMVKHAKSILRDYLGSSGGNVSNELLQDYGVLLYYTKEYDLATEAFSRLLGKQLDFSIKRTALLYKYLLALKKNKEKEAEFIFDSLLEDDPSLCKDSKFDFYSYWPNGLEEEVDGFVEAGCKNAD